MENLWQDVAKKRGQSGNFQASYPLRLARRCQSSLPANAARGARWNDGARPDKMVGGGVKLHPKLEAPQERGSAAHG